MKLNFQKVRTLPHPLVPGTIYWVDDLKTTVVAETENKYILYNGNGEAIEEAIEAALTNANKYTDEKVKVNSDAIDILTGTEEGSIKHTVSSEISKVVNSAPETFDTLKEIADWIAQDETDSTKLIKQVEDNTKTIEDLSEELNEILSVVCSLDFNNDFNNDFTIGFKYDDTRD